MGSLIRCNRVICGGRTIRCHISDLFVDCTGETRPQSLGDTDGQVPDVVGGEEIEAQTKHEPRQVDQTLPRRYGRVLRKANQTSETQGIISYTVSSNVIWNISCQ